MKALVVEVTDKYIIALKSDGTFVKISKSGYVKSNNVELNVGDEIELFRCDKTGSRINRAISRAAAIAAAFLLLFGFSYAVYCYYKPYSYISVDINPSVEITANVYDRVINVEGINEDGQKIAALKEYKNKSVRDGIKEIMVSALEQGYIKQDYENMMLLTISSKDEKKLAKLENELQEVISEQVNKSNINTSLYIEEINVSKHDNAKSMEISPGKYLLIEKLKESNPEVNIEYDKIKESSVRELMDVVTSNVKDKVFENKLEKAKEKSKISGNERGNREDTVKLKSVKTGGKDTTVKHMQNESGRGKEKQDDKGKAVKENNRYRVPDNGLKYYGKQHLGVAGQDNISRNKKDKDIEADKGKNNDKDNESKNTGKSDGKNNKNNGKLFNENNTNNNTNNYNNNISQNHIRKEIKKDNNDSKNRGNTNIKENNSKNENKVKTNDREKNGNKVKTEKENKEKAENNGKFENSSKIKKNGSNTGSNGNNMNSGNSSYINSNSRNNKSQSITRLKK